MDPSPNSNSGRAIGGLLRTIGSVILVAAIVWWADPEDVWTQLRNASLVGVLAVIALHVLDRLLMAYKWWRLLRVRGFEVTLGDAIRSYFLASFVGAVLPVAGGADLARIAAVRGRGANTEALVASVALERVLGAVSHGVFCLGAVGLLLALRIDLEISTSTLALAAGVLLVALTAFLPISFGIAEHLSRRDGGAGLGAKLQRFGADYAAWRSHPAELWIFLTLTFIEGFYPIVGYWAAAQALGLEVTLVQMAIAVPLTFLIARLPIPLPSFGPEQGAFVVITTQLGIAAPVATAITLLFLGTLLIAFAPGAVAWMSARAD